MVYDMITVPAFTPETTPVTAPTVAIEVLLLLHVPPATLSESVVVADWQKVALPDIVPEAGGALTVIAAVATDVPQPAVTE